MLKPRAFSGFSAENGLHQHHCGSDEYLQNSGDTWLAEDDLHAAELSSLIPGSKKKTTDIYLDFKVKGALYVSPQDSFGKHSLPPASCTTAEI